MFVGVFTVRIIIFEEYLIWDNEYWMR